MQLPLERARQIVVMAQRLDADRPAGILQPGSTDADAEAIRAELDELAAWLRLGRVAVERVVRGGLSAVAPIGTASAATCNAVAARLRGATHGSTPPVCYQLAVTTKRAEVFTGVASGGLGTGTALDDTQVYDVAALNRPEPTEAEPVAAKPTAAEPAAPLPVAVKPVAHRVPATRSATATEARQPATRPRRTVPGPVWLVGGAAAAVLVFGLLGAAWGNRAPGAAGDAGLDGGSNLPAAIATPSIAPDEGGGNGKGNGRGGGNGNGNGGDDDD